MPTIITSSYLFFIAEDQFDSEASFSVRSLSSSAPTDVLGMFAQASGGDTRTDSFILSDYILGEELMLKSDQRFDLQKMYAERGHDFFFSLWPESSVERKLRYWRSMVSVSFDGTSGILNLLVKAFDAKAAQDLTAFIVDEGDRVINSLSSEARRGVLDAAHEEVANAEARLARARLASQRYREETQEVDPATAATLSNNLIGRLEQQAADLSADLTTARTQMAVDSPRVRRLQSQLDGIQQQIRVEKSRIGRSSQKDDPNMPVARRITDFAALQTEEDFSQRAYTTALSSLERARVDATSRQHYLAVFLRPTLSQDAEYPRRIVDAVILFFGFLFIWAIGLMAYGNIRDRA
jgi:capsular polysaccharide transport system permease protein